MLPDGWQESILNTVSHIVDCKHRTPKYVEKGVPLISPGTIKWGAIDLVSPTKHVSQEEYISLMDHCEVEIGDLVMGRNQSVGIASYVDIINPFVLGQDTILIKPSDTDSQFLFYSLQSTDVQRKIFKLAGGSTFSRINLGDIRKLKIAFPSQEKQKKIVKILATWDKAITTTEQLIANSQQQKKALMQQLLTGKKRLAGFSGDWEEVRLEFLTDGKKQKGRIVPTNENSKGLPYIGSTSFNGVFELFTDSERAIKCEADDLLVLWDGENAGKSTTGLIGVVSSTVVKFILKKELSDSIFIHSLFIQDNGVVA